MAGKIIADTIETGAGADISTSYVVNGSAKAWAEIGAGGGSLPDSFNISSLDDDGSGLYGLNFTNSMTNANYSASLTMTFDHSLQSDSARVVAVESKSASSVEVETAYITSAGIFYHYDLEDNVNSTSHGDLA